MRQRWWFAGMVLALLLVLSACSKSSSSSSAGGSGGSAGGGGNAVTVKDFAFSPNSLTATSGTALTVQVTNNGSTTHSFTLDDGSVSQDVQPGTTEIVTLTLTKTAGWHCKYHPTMTGTITVA